MKRRKKKRRVVVRDPRRAALVNYSPRGAVVIYHRIGGIWAQKGPGHACDPKCKKAGHWYEHKFTGRFPVLGLPNGRLLI
jgi:hypothetical protein